MRVLPGVLDCYKVFPLNVMTLTQTNTAEIGVNTRVHLVKFLHH